METMTFVNQLSLDEAGWAQLAPFGDYPGQAMMRQADGSITPFPAIQRLDRAAAEVMVAKFKSPWQRLKRYFVGCPIYSGHPDVPAFAKTYPDKSPKGMIVDLEAREDGLFCKPVFTNEGSDLVETRQLRALSAYWSANEIGEQAGADGQMVKIFRPEVLHSAGLTNRPNLPVQLLNECFRTGNEARQEMGSKEVKDGAHGVTRPTTKGESNINMNREIVIQFLATQGVTLANQATDEQIAAALEQLGERVAVAETTLAARNLEFETVRAELANERKFHTDTLLDAATSAGRITAAQRPEWTQRLETDFANAATALEELTPVLKTTALTQHLGARRAEIANAPDRREALDVLLKAEMAVNGGDYDRAFAAVQKANPALFAAMRQPVVG